MIWLIGEESGKGRGFISFRPFRRFLPTNKNQALACLFSLRQLDRQLDSQSVRWALIHCDDPPKVHTVATWVCKEWWVL